MDKRIILKLILKKWGMKDWKWVNPAQDGALSTR